MPDTNMPPRGFYILPGGELSFEDFKRFPVWSEHYDYDEIDEIVSWGIDREWLIHEFRRLDVGGPHCYYPVLETAPRLPARMGMSVKANLITAGGRHLEGIVSQFMDCVGIHYDGDGYDFHSDFPDLAEANLANLRRLQTKLEGDPVFPLRVSTGFVNSEGESIEGTFSPSLP